MSELICFACLDDHHGWCDRYQGAGAPCECDDPLHGQDADTGERLAHQWDRQGVDGYEL